MYDVISLASALFVPTWPATMEQSDEVYDEGREFTLYEYKVMADHFESKWSKREPPPGLKRRAPRRVKNEVQWIAVHLF